MWSRKLTSRIFPEVFGFFWKYLLVYLPGFHTRFFPYRTLVFIFPPKILPNSYQHFFETRTFNSGIFPWESSRVQEFRPISPGILKEFLPEGFPMLFKVPEDFCQDLFRDRHKNFFKDISQMLSWNFCKSFSKVLRSLSTIFCRPPETSSKVSPIISSWNFG